jgi:ribosomal protein L31E
VPFTYQIAADDAITAIKDFVKKQAEIDMVLLSPNLSVSKKSIDLKKLIKNITKPIVSISVPAKAGA